MVDLTLGGNYRFWQEVWDTGDESDCEGFTEETNPWQAQHARYRNSEKAQRSEKKKKKDTAEHIFINPTAADGRCILLVVWR